MIDLRERYPWCQVVYPAATLDIRQQRIPCNTGYLTAFGDSLLALHLPADLPRRERLVQLLLKKGCKLHSENVLAFPVDAFHAVAALVQPRTKTKFRSRS
jgi:hypothetical protein